MRQTITLLCALAILSPAIASAQKHLICQGYLSQTGCDKHVGLWPSGVKVRFVASCQECEGGGADLKCSPDEVLTTAVLIMENSWSQPVSGSFSQVGHCIGQPIFVFDGLADKGGFKVIADVAGHGRTLLFSFEIEGGAAGDGTSPSGDGTTPSGDGSTPGDGSSSTPDGGTPGGDGSSPSGDGGGGNGGGSDDGGCDCAVSARPAPTLLLLALGLLLLSRRRQR